MEETKKTILVFCANEQKETEHSVKIDGYGEVVLTCLSNIGTEDEPIECGRFLKYPKGTTVVGLRELIAKHKVENEGQISVASIENEEAKIIDALTGGGGKTEDAEAK